MRRIALTLCILVGNIIVPPLFYKEGVRGSCALADELAMAASVPVVAKTTLTGVIKSVSWADPSKGTKSEIVVKETSGKLIHILVTSTTTLWDADAKPVMPDKIAVKNKVNVIYFTSPEGINVSKSIKILK